MAVKTGPGAQRQTAVARSVSDLGALMSAKAEAQAQPQPDIQVQAEVSVLPESNHNLTGATSVTKEADLQSTLPTTAQSEQTLKEEITMAKNTTTQAEVNPALAAAPAMETNDAPTTANVNASADAAAEATTSTDTSAATTTAPTQTHGDLDRLLADATPDVNVALTTPTNMVDYLQGRDNRFKTLVTITKDTVSRVDALEAGFAELRKNDITKSSTLTVKSPDWKDQIVDGLLIGGATAVGVFGIAYAFDAMFGQPQTVVVGEPAIQ